MVELGNFGYFNVIEGRVGKIGDTDSGQRSYQVFGYLKVEKG